MKKYLIFLLVFVIVLSSFFIVNAQENYEILKNGSFEENDEFTWIKFITSAGIIEYFDEEYVSGEYSMLIYDREHCTDTIRQYVTDEVNYYGQGKYQIKAKVKLYEEHPTKVCGNAVIRVENTSNEQNWFTTSYVEFTTDKWAEISFTTDISWKGELKVAEFYFVTDEPNESETFASLIIDDCSFMPLDFDGEVYTAPTPTPEPTVKPTEKPTPKPTATTNAKPQQTQKVENTPGVTENNQEQNVENNGGNINNKQLIIIGSILIAVGVMLLVCSTLVLVSCRKEKQNEKKE